MYRIKTDIRQYKCESIDKVEKLIRNWVIRPNDLIYHSDARDWLPIGEHPAFQKLFGILEEREASEPDTVVTSNHPLRNGRAPGDGEATQITERPEFEDDESKAAADDASASDEPKDSDGDDETLDSRETDIFDADQIADSLAERDRAEANGDDAADDGTEEADDLTEVSDSEEVIDEETEDDLPDITATDDNGDDDDVDEDHEDDEDDEMDAESSTSGNPAPPEPPEGVEPPVNDEITVMTDKTLEMLKVDDDGDEPEPDVPGDDEATQVAERPTAPDEEEATNVTERPTDPNGEEEATNVTERPTLDDDESTNVTERPVADDSEETQVTERPEPEDGESEDAEESSESGEHKVIVAAPEEPVEQATPKGVGRHDLPEEFFATNEISGPIFEESAKVIDDLAAMEEARQSAGNEVDDGWDDIDEQMEGSPGPLGLRDTDELDGVEPDDDADSDDSDEEIIVDPLDETAVPVADEWDEDVSQIASEDTSPGIVEIEEFISDGYSLPLPFPIRPDEKDVALGLKRSKASKGAKDARFPYPKPKKRGEVHARVYYFSEEQPRDLSIPLVVGLVIVFALIATTFAIC